MTVSNATHACRAASKARRATWQHANAIPSQPSVRQVRVRPARRLPPRRIPLAVRKAVRKAPFRAAAFPLFLRHLQARPAKIIAAWARSAGSTPVARSRKRNVSRNVGPHLPFHLHPPLHRCPSPRLVSAMNAAKEDRIFAASRVSRVSLSRPFRAFAASTVPLPPHNQATSSAATARKIPENSATPATSPPKFSAAATIARKCVAETASLIPEIAAYSEA